MLFLAPLLLFTLSALSAPALEDCHGCVALAPPASANLPGGGVLTVTVALSDGFCLTGWVGGIPTCYASPCTGNAVGQWSGLPADETLQACKKDPSGVLRCMFPPPNSGSGTGATPPQFVSLACDGGAWEFSLSYDGVAATVTAICSACE